MYEYTVVNADSFAWALKRGVIYVAILLLTVATALVVLFILFELYLALFACLGMYVFSIGLILLVGRRKDVFKYVASAEKLTISDRGKVSATFTLKELENVKKAEFSDFLDKKITKFAFPKTKSVIKIASEEGANAFAECIFEYEGKRYILSLDDYMTSIILRSKQ